VIAVQVQISVYVTVELAQWLKAQPNQSETVRQALELLRKQKEGK
jgi:Arc/MetJ-type ribon-helix-helix transcriptional regulator